MERVRDLSWGVGFGASEGEARTRFEPVFRSEAADNGESSERADATAPELPDELRRVVERITRSAREGAREP